MILRLPTRTISFPRRPLLMGIVNINSDSFSGDGTLDIEEALDHAERLVASGADLIDVGGESARTNRVAIPAEEEIARIAPFINRWKGRVAESRVGPRDELQVWPPILSINTWRPPVAEAALAAGGELLNDMSGLPDQLNARVAAKYGAALLIMHSVGEPKVAHTHVHYRDVMQELRDFFSDKMEQAESSGLDSAQIVLDPGIDFAKQREDNLRIFRELATLTEFGCPILMPVSRKTVIGEVLGIERPVDRDAGTMAAVIAGLEAGAAIFRVHHVEAAYQTVKLWEAVHKGFGD